MKIEVYRKNHAATLFDIYILTKYKGDLFWAIETDNARYLLPKPPISIPTHRGIFYIDGRLSGRIYQEGDLDEN